MRPEDHLRYRAPAIRYPDPLISPRLQTEDLIVAMTLGGEARGEPYLGKVAVACVIQNRVAQQNPRRYGKGIRGVILKPLQFSCWNRNDPNYPRLANPRKYWPTRQWEDCYNIAWAVVDCGINDITGGADHYYSERVFQDKPPSWADGMLTTCRIGWHRFLSAAGK